jgi:hypothetical protein
MDTRREIEDTRALHKVTEVEWHVCGGVTSAVNLYQCYYKTISVFFYDN